MGRIAIVAGGVLLLAGVASAAEPFAAERARPAPSPYGANTMTLGLHPGQEAVTEKTCFGWGCRPFYGFYRPFFFNYYYSPFFYSYSFYRPFWWGCAGDLSDVPPAVALGRVDAYRDPNGSLPQRTPDAAAPVPAPQTEDRTFPYDGGPRQQVPMPEGEARPQPQPKPAPQVEGRFASLRGTAQPVARRFEYPAYGEESRPAFAQDRDTLPVTRR